MIDIVKQIEAVQREVGSGTLAAGEGHAVRLRRTYDASMEEVWDALTDPERIGRWFLPISGDYRLGGRYQFEGNAGGEILACERPRRLRASWVYGEVSSPADVSEVELRLTSVRAMRLDDARARARRDRAGGVLDHVRAGRGRCRLGGRVARSRAAPAAAAGRRIPSPGSLRRGPGLQHQEQPGLGRRVPAAGEDPAAVATMVANTTQFYAPDPEAPS